MYQKLFFILLLAGTVRLQAQDILWQRKTGGGHAEYLYDAMPTLDYGFMMVGGSLSQPANLTEGPGDFDFFISKINEKGQQESIAYYGGSQTDMAKCLTNSPDGGYIVGGISHSPDWEHQPTVHLGGTDIRLLKFDPAGRIIWQAVLGGHADEDISRIIKTRDGGYLIAASSASDTYIGNLPKPDKQLHVITKQADSYGNMDYWLVKLDAGGQEQWQVTLGGKYRDFLIDLTEDSQGNIYLGGISNSPVSGQKTVTGKGKDDWWLVKLNKTGQLLWQKTMGSDGADKLSKILLTKSQKSLLVAGNFTESNAKKLGNSDMALVALDTGGNILWQKTYDNGANDYLTDVFLNDDGSMLLSGYTAAPKVFGQKLPAVKKGIDDFLMIKTDAIGKVLWRRSVGGLKKEVLLRSVETRDGGYVLMGDVMPLKNTGKNNTDFLIVKIRDKDKPLHPKLPLEAIPNPVRDYTSVVIGKDYDKGILQVTDINGKMIRQRILNGKRLVPVRLNRLPVGVYIISVRVDDDLQNSVKVIKSH